MKRIIGLSVMLTLGAALSLALASAPAGSAGLASLLKDRLAGVAATSDRFALCAGFGSGLTCRAIRTYGRTTVAIYLRWTPAAPAVRLVEGLPWMTVQGRPAVLGRCRPCPGTDGRAHWSIRVAVSDRLIIEASFRLNLEQALAVLGALDLESLGRWG